MRDTDPRHRDDFDAQGWPNDRFSKDLGHGQERNDTGAPDEATRRLANHELPGLNEVLSKDERERLYVLREGATLEQGSTYVDLARLEEGPFTAIGGRTAGEDEHLLSKRAADFDTWNKLVGDAQPRTERPDET